MDAFGGDFSAWQNDISTPQDVDFLKAVNAVPPMSFVGIKVSQACRADRDFTYNWDDAKDHGLLRMGYHFLDWTRSALEQADFFCGMLYDHLGEIYPVLDYECRTGVPAAGTARLACKEFLEYVTKNLKVTPMIYTGNDYWKNYGSADVYWTRYPLWIAWPLTGITTPDKITVQPRIPAPWKDWLFWQFSWKGDGRKYGAESFDLDLDVFNGDVAALKTRFGGTPEPDYTLEQKVTIMWNVLHSEGKV